LISPLDSPIICGCSPATGTKSGTKDEDRVPNIKSARKRYRQSLKRRAHNRSVRSEIRTRAKKLLATESADEAEAMLKRLYSLLDQAAGRRILHPNAAARQKARLARHVDRLQG
jgi:small subunit ribosomal protein S20